MLRVIMVSYSWPMMLVISHDVPLVGSLLLSLPLVGSLLPSLPLVGLPLHAILHRMPPHQVATAKVYGTLPVCHHLHSEPLGTLEHTIPIGIAMPPHQVAA